MAAASVPVMTALRHGADIAAGAKSARPGAPYGNRLYALVRRPFLQALRHADAHAVGQRVQGLWPVQGDEAQRALCLEQDMGVGLSMAPD